MSSGTALDQALMALADPHRRRILEALLDHDGRDGGSVDPMAAVAGDGRVDTASRAELYHAHLPRLADLGYVEWDRERGLVSRGPNFGEVATLLRLIRDHYAELPAQR